MKLRFTSPAPRWRVCVVCRKPILPTRKTQRSCSKRCRKRMDNTTYAERQRQRRLGAQRALHADLQRYRDQHAQLAAQVILRGLRSPDPRIRRLAETLAMKRGLR